MQNLLYKKGNGRGKGEGRGGEEFVPQCSLAVDAIGSRAPNVNLGSLISR